MAPFFDKLSAASPSVMTQHPPPSSGLPSSHSTDAHRPCLSPPPPPWHHPPDHHGGRPPQAKFIKVDIDSSELSETVASENISAVVGPCPH